MTGFTTLQSRHIPGSALTGPRGRGWIVGPFLVVAIVAVTRQAGAPDISHGFHSWPVALTDGDRMVQSLSPPVGGIEAVSLQIDRVKGDGTLVVEWGVEGAGHSEMVRSRTIAFRDLPASGKWTMDFGRAVGAPKQPLQLQLSVRGAVKGSTVTFWVTEGHVYRGGNLSLNGRALPGDLVLHAKAPGARVWRLAARAFAGMGGGVVAALLGLTYLALVSLLIAKWEGSPVS